MTRLMVFLAFLFTACFAHAQDITGDWQGTLKTGMGELRLVLHITKAADGSLQATLDSIDQPGENGIPVQSITLRDARLNLDITAAHGTYDGKVSADAKTISGVLWLSHQKKTL